MKKGSVIGLLGLLLFMLCLGGLLLGFYQQTPTKELVSATNSQTVVMALEKNTENAVRLDAARTVTLLFAGFALGIILLTLRLPFALRRQGVGTSGEDDEAGDTEDDPGQAPAMRKL